MTIARTILLLATMTIVMVLSACTTGSAPKVAGERSDVLYFCDCGDACQCNSVSTAPGPCQCGKPMKWGHVVKVEGDEVLVCTCAEGCSCSIDPKDATRCACGHELKRISLKGTGIYFCNCGGSCYCNTVSSQPGACKCGMALKKID